jgi:hypothetical protein
MFLRQQEGVFGFSFNHLVDGGVHKFLGVKGHGLRWITGKWLDEGNVV